MDMHEQELSLEENFARLEEMIEKLREDDLPLEEAFRAYSQGMAILKQCDGQMQLEPLGKI